MTSPRARVGAPPVSKLSTNVTIAVWQEGVHWLSECLEFGVGSFGPSPDQAADEAIDALCSYLNTLEELGERERVFRERSIVTYATEPLEFSLARLPSEFTRRAGFQLRARELPLTFA
jgi:hypothetical protein